MVSNRVEAAAAVAPALFSARQPLLRPGPGLHGHEQPRCCRHGDGVLCFVMVETPRGCREDDEIASTPGDRIYVGPADLALGLGLQPISDKEEPEHVAAVERILAACRSTAFVPGIQCGNGKGGPQAGGTAASVSSLSPRTRRYFPLRWEKEVAALGVRDRHPECLAERLYVTANAKSAPQH